MKKFIVALTLALVSVIGASAADLTEVWNQISANPTYLTAPVKPEIATKQGFIDLNVSLNPEATTTSINELNSLISTITANQKLASSTQNGVTVTIFATPADTTASAFNVMYVLTGATGGLNEQIVLFGKVSRENMASALTKINIEEIIGV